MRGDILLLSFLSFNKLKGPFWMLWCRITPGLKEVLVSLLKALDKVVASLPVSMELQTKEIFFGQWYHLGFSQLGNTEKSFKLGFFFKQDPLVAVHEAVLHGSWSHDGVCLSLTRYMGAFVQKLRDGRKPMRTASSLYFSHFTLSGFPQNSSILVKISHLALLRRLKLATWHSHNSYCKKPQICMPDYLLILLLSHSAFTDMFLSWQESLFCLQVIESLTLTWLLN